MKNFSVSNRFWVALTTVAIIASVFAYYLLVYSANRRESYIDRKYRILTRMGDNVVSLNSDVTKAKNRDLNNAMGEIEEDKKKSACESIEALCKLDCSIPLLQFFKDNNRKYQDLKEFYVRRKTNAWNLAVFHPDSIFIKTDFQVTGHCGASVRPGFVYFQTSIHTILSRLGTTREIGDYFIIRSFNKPNSTSSEIESINRIAYQTQKNKMLLIDFDSLLVTGDRLQPSQTWTTVINSDNYLVLPHRLNFMENEDWIICMLIKEKDLDAYSRQLELWIVVYAFLIGLFILIAMPILKLLLMSPLERLRMTNVWFSGFSICMGTSILTLILLGIYHYYGHYRQTDRKLQRLANAVETKFSNELDNIYLQLKQLKNLEGAPWKDGPVKIGYIADPNSIPASVKRLDSDQKPDTSYSAEILFYKNLLSLKYFNEIIWIDSTGHQLGVLTTHEVNTAEKPLNLSGRKYFSSVMGNDLWALPSNELKQGQFSIQSIRSWRSSREEVGFAIPANEAIKVHKDSAAETAKVLLMATQLYSVMDVITPPGYGFCLVDKGGEVMFHSQTDRNLQENFITETGETRLLAAIQGRVEIETDAAYYDRKIRAHIQPVRNTELFLITYYDLEFYKSPLILTLGFAAALIIFLYVVQGLQQLALLITTYKRTRLAVRWFYLDWLRPLPDVALTDCNKIAIVQYIRSIKTQFFLAIFLTVLMMVTRERWLAFCFIILPAYLLLFHFILLKKSFAKPKGADGRSGGLSHPFAKVSIALIIIANTFAYPYLESAMAAILVQGVIVLLLRYGEKIDLPAVNNMLNKIKTFPFPKPYMICMFYWLLLSGVMPVVYFYKCGYYEELGAWTRYLQLQAASQCAERNVMLQADLDAKSIKLDSLEFTEVRTLGDYIESTGEIVYTRLSSCYNRIHPSPYFELLFKIAPISSDLLEKGKSSIFPQASDRQWTWFSDRKSSVLLHFTPVRTIAGEQSPSYYLSSTIPDFTFSNADYLLTFIISIVVLCYLIYKVLRYAIAHIFGTDLLRMKETYATVDDFYKTIEPVFMEKKQMMTFLVGLPNSGKSILINRVKGSYADRFETVNFRNDSLKASKTKQVIFLRHFESGINDHRRNNEKLKFLYSILEDHDKSVIILSSVQPSVIVDFYERKISDICKLPRDNENRKEMQEYKQAIRQWRNLLREFEIIYMPLQSVNKEPDSFLDYELNNGSFLPKLKDKLVSTDDSSYKKREEIILQIEEMAESYYTGLWNAFSNTEKLVLFDLAKDRFVNTSNTPVLRMLINKGIITCNDSIRIMNKSFNDFVLRIVKVDEEVAMEKQSKQEGIWYTVQLILFLVFIAIAILIALAEEKLIQNLNGLISAIGGITALLLRFGGFFGSSDKTKA